MPLLLSSVISKGPRRALLESSGTHQILNPEPYVRHGGRTLQAEPSVSDSRAGTPTLRAGGTGGVTKGNRWCCERRLSLAILHYSLRGVLHITMTAAISDVSPRQQLLEGGRDPLTRKPDATACVRGYRTNHPPVSPVNYGRSMPPAPSPTTAPPLLWKYSRAPISPKSWRENPADQRGAP